MLFWCTRLSNYETYTETLSRTLKKIVIEIFLLWSNEMSCTACLQEHVSCVILVKNKQQTLWGYSCCFDFSSSRHPWCWACRISPHKTQDWCTGSRASSLWNQKQGKWWYGAKHSELILLLCTSIMGPLIHGKGDKNVRVWWTPKEYLPPPCNSSAAAVPGYVLSQQQKDQIVQHENQRNYNSLSWSQIVSWCHVSDRSWSNLCCT